MQSSLPCTRRRGSGQRFAVQVGGLYTITLHTHPFYPVRYDFTMGPKGQLDRLPVAHTGPILTFDWCAPDGGIPGSGGWIASGSLDRTVKVWDVTGPHFERTPTYTIATQFPVRRVRWRPGYECELAVASNAEFGIGSMSDVNDSDALADADLEKPEVAPTKRRTDIGNGVEIWDVRRGYIAKWQVGGSAIEGGVSGRSPLYTYSEPRLKYALFINRYRVPRRTRSVDAALIWDVRSTRSQEFISSLGRHAPSRGFVDCFELACVRDRQEKRVGGPIR